jgi:hypothetical protein
VRHFVLKNAIILPRQARHKHRESTLKRDLCVFFLQMLNITIPAGVAPGDMFQVQVPIMPQVPAKNHAPFLGGSHFHTKRTILPRQAWDKHGES